MSQKAIIELSKSHLSLLRLPMILYSRMISSQIKASIGGLITIATSRPIGLLRETAVNLLVKLVSMM